MTATVEDPFALPDFKPERDPASPHRGRYWLPNLDGSKHPGGFMRVSNLVSAYSDQFALRVWELGEVLKGLEISSELYGALVQARPASMPKDDLRAWVEEFIEHAKEASGGNEGSNFGTQRHASVETAHAGLPTGHLDAGTRRHLALYASALERNDLTALPGMQERVVLVEALEVCGTMDNVLHDRRTGEHVIGDLKTQRRFWTWLEIGAQLATYAHGDAVWDRERGCWMDMPRVSQDVAMVLWMPRGQWFVDVHEVDLRKGWVTAQRAYEVVKDRQEAKSVKGGRAWLRSAPPATVVEQYAARFAAVDSFPEGRELVAECRREGVWCAVLAQSAQDARDRLAVPA